MPAHDEEDWLPASLAAVRAAAAHPLLRGRPVDVVVVLDACTDGSATVAAAAGARMTTVDSRSVGAARAAGFASVLGRGGDPARCWLATTDADTRVPRDWLARHVVHAERGVDAVVGTVRVEDWSEHPPSTPHRFAVRYHGPDDEHPHVHGANLGVRGSAYLDVGGMPPLPLAEDHAIVAALAAAGHRVLRTRSLAVVTSARRRGRAPGGFADHLRALAVEGDAGRRTA